MICSRILFPILSAVLSPSLSSAERSEEELSLSSFEATFISSKLARKRLFSLAFFPTASTFFAASSDFLYVVPNSPEIKLAIALVAVASPDANVLSAGMIAFTIGVNAT